MTSLAKKTALVMGASSPKGMGAAIAQSLASAGATVAISARSTDKLAETAESLGVHHHTCDVTDEASLEKLFAWFSERFGQLDYAVFATGLNHYSPIASLNPLKAMPVLQTQLIGGLLFIKHSAAAMTRGGAITLLSSLTANLPAPGTAVYAGTKAAMDQAMRVAALEYAEQGIRINSVAPGMVRTEMTESMFASPGLERAVNRETPLGRMATGAEVAAAVRWLCDADCYVTGSVLPVSGGAELRRIPTFEEIMG